MSRISDLMLRVGDAEAQKTANRGRLWGQVIGQVADAPMTLARMRQAADDRALQNQAAQSQLATADLQRQNIRSEMGARDKDQAAQDAQRELTTKLAAHNREFQGWLTNVAGQPDAQAQAAAYAAGIADLTARGVFDADDKKYLPAVYPGQGWVKAQLARAGMADTAIKSIFPEAKLHNVNAGDTVLDANNPSGGAVFTAPPKPEKETRSLDVQAAEALAKGDTATYARLQKVKKDMGQADDRPPDPMLSQIREMTLANLRKGQAAMTPAQFSMATRLADDYTQQSKDYLTRVQAFDAITSAAQNPSAAGDLALIFSYMRMLDPGSTVREGEFANAQNAAGIPDKVKNLYNRAISGERLNPAQRTDFVNQAGAQFRQSQQRQQGLIKVYTERAQRSNLNPADVVIDYDQVFGAQKPAQAPTAPKPGTIRARDPQGVLHEAAVGTALPAGWRQEP